MLSYKDNFTEDELDRSSEFVKRVLKLENALPSDILKYKVNQAIKKF